MNKEEIRHFKSLLRQGSLRHMNILLNDKFQSELLDIIKDYERLIKENQKQKEVIDKAKSLSHEISHTIYEDFLEENIIGSKFLYERIKKQLSILEDNEVSE